MKNLIGAALLAGLSAVIAMAQPQKPADDSALLVGDWKGDSICKIRPGICHDEKALYRVKKGDAADHYAIDVYKIIDSEPQQIGSVACTYAASKHELSCATPILHLVLQGKSLKGTMNLPDGTVARQISLKKDGA
jgi:hypothetical protein